MDSKKLVDQPNSKKMGLPSEINSSDLDYYSAIQMRNEQLQAEIETIKNSRSYKFIEKIKRLPGVHTLARLLLFITQITKTRKSKDKNLPINLGIPNVSESGQTKHDYARKIVGGSSQKYNWDENEIRWIQEQAGRRISLSINHPDWRGILASSKQLFENIYTVPDILNQESSHRLASLFAEAEIKNITIQGFPLTYYHLVKALSRINKQIKVNLIWHGNFLHSKEDYSWQSWKLVLKLYEDHEINRIGFVKYGMTEVYKSIGMNAYFILNYVRQIPEKASVVQQTNPLVGIWGEPDWGWKKLPYSMIASLKLIHGAQGSAINVSRRAEEFGEMLSVNCDFVTATLTHENTLAKLKKMHLNIYSSLTECAPMLPLESLSMGVPCILGPTSHYFRDDEWLYKQLIITSPDDAYSIAQTANLALNNRAEIITRYRRYAIEYNKRAQEALQNFLN